MSKPAKPQSYPLRSGRGHSDCWISIDQFQRQPSFSVASLTLYGYDKKTWEIRRIRKMAAWLNQLADWWEWRGPT